MYDQARVELRYSEGDPCQARAIDIRASANPGLLISGLLERVARLEDDVFRLEGLADSGPPAHAARTRALAASAARSADALRRRVAGLRHELDVRAIVEQLVGEGAALGDLLATLEQCVAAHDERQANGLTVNTLRRELVASGAARDDYTGDDAVSLPKTVSRGVRTAHVRKSRPPVRSHPATPVTPCAEALVADYPAHRERALAAVAVNGGETGPTIRAVDIGALEGVVQVHFRKLMELKQEAIEGV